MTKRILVVDDSLTICKVIKIAFSQFEVQVQAAHNFVEALSAIHLDKPDVILADATLPGTSSPADFQRLIVEAHGAPLILLYGTYDDIDEQAFINVGMNRLVRKPFDSGEIVNQVRQVLGYEFTRKKVAAAGGSFAKGGVKDGLLAGIQPAKPKPLASEIPIPDVQISAELADLAGDREIMAGISPETLTDNRRKGERAFNLPPVPGARPTPVVDPIQPEREVVGAKAQPSFAEAFPRAEWERLVRETVEDYCARHFPQLAKQVISQEIRRLTDEKARHLVDN